MANDVKVLIKSLYDGKGVRDATKDLNALEKSSISLGQGMRNAFSVMAGGIGTITAVGFAVKKALDFGAEGAGITRLEDSFASLTRIAGTSGDELLRALDKASHGTIANSDLILSTNRAMMLGLGADVDQLSSLMEVAAFRGRAMGLSTTQAFNDIVTGVGRGSPMILDNLGIIVDAEQTYTKYAESIGKAASELTKQEKTTALLTRVLEEGNRQMEAAGGLTQDTAEAYEQLNAQSKNYFDTLKKGVGESLEPVARGLAKMFEIESEVQRLMEQGMNPYEARRQAIKNIEDGIADLENETRVWTSTELRAITEAESFDRAMTQQARTLEEHTPAIEDNTDALKEQSNAYKSILSNMSRLSDASERFADDEQRRAEKQKELEQEKSQLAIEVSKRRQEGNLSVEEENKYAIKQIELTDKINKLNEEATKAVEEQEQARKKLLYTILEQKAASEASAGGADITKEEFEFLQQMQVELGLTDAASANAAIAISEDADSIWGAFQDATGSVNDVKTALDAVVHGSPYVARIQIETVGGVPNISGSIGGTTRAPTVFNPRTISSGHRSGHGYAEGGQFVIPDQYGYEGFNMGGMATASGGETVTITPRGKGGSMVLNLNIANIRSLSDIDYLVQEVQRKMG